MILLFGSYSDGTQRLVKVVGGFSSFADLVVATKSIKAKQF